MGSNLVLKKAKAGMTEREYLFVDSNCATQSDFSAYIITSEENQL